MSLVETLLIGILQLLNLGLWVYMWIVIARVIMSWVNLNPDNPAVRFLLSATEPILSAIRKRLPLQYGGFDFSPILLIIFISFLRGLVTRLLFSLAGPFG